MGALAVVAEYGRGFVATLSITRPLLGPSLNHADIFVTGIGLAVAETMRAHSS